MTQPAVAFTILGQPYSKANSRRWTGKQSIKSEKALAYARDAHLQAPKAMLEGELRITMNIFYASERPDLDPSLILDALQGKVYANDRQVREIHLYHAIDKKNPRAEIVVEPRGNPLFKRVGP